MATLEKQYHEELKMEITGTAVDAAPVEEEGEEGEEEDPDAVIKQMAKDNDTISISTMSNKKRKLYEAMKVGFYIYQFFVFVDSLYLRGLKAACLIISNESFS